MVMLAFSDAVQVAIVATTGPTLIGLIGLWLQYSNRGNIQKIEKSTNSMKDALVKATGEAKHAEGMAAGIQQEKAEAKGRERA